MPVSILTSLMLWSSLLPTGAGVDEPHRPILDSPGYRAVSFDSFPAIVSALFQESDSWRLSEADIEEDDEEGGSEALVGASSWFGLPLFGGGGGSSIQANRGSLPSPVRSPILRC